MSLKIVILCLAMILTLTTEPTAAYRKREWRKRQVGDEEFQMAMAEIERMIEELEDQFGPLQRRRR